MKMQIVRDLMDDVWQMLAARQGRPDTFTARIYSSRDESYSGYAFVDARNPEHPAIELTLRRDGGDLPHIKPIVVADWSAAARFVAAF